LCRRLDRAAGQVIEEHEVLEHADRLHRNEQREQSCLCTYMSNRHKTR
jgi:hypothetical protein